jgi:hypothetical protein
MPAGLHHPFSRALYERHDEGTIRVTDGDREGVFTSEGEWISGELRACDPQLCGWVAGPQMLNHRMSESAPEG